MTTAAQILRQAESLKASLIDSAKASLADTSNISKTSNGGGGVTDNSAISNSSSSDGKGDSGDGGIVKATTAGNGGSMTGEKIGKDGGGGRSMVVGDLWVTRQKLEDVYKRLLLMDLEYALDKKVEQDLWNHAFKNQITALQVQSKEKQNPKKAEVQASLNLFLETASGFYLQFLQLICSTFHLDLPFRRKSSAFGVMKEKTQLRAKITPPKRNSCLYICQYCLVHLGDIARYRQQTEQAQTYYRHAVNLSPHNGQPYNQLAILEVNRNNKLCSVFYYVRSLAVRHPFPAAATNLEKFYAKLIKDTSEFKGKMAQNEFVNAFLQFQALLHLAADLRRASHLCSRILACLPSLLQSQTFSGSVLVQCVAITIFTFTHLRHLPPAGDPSSTSGPKGEGGGEGGGKGIGRQTEALLSAEEQKTLDMILGFTASVLELSVQHTPAAGVKGVRESPTLPAVQVLLDWLITSPDLITLPPFANSNIWGHLAKMLNMVQQGEEGKPSLDLTKYEDVPLPEDTELRCFQPMEKAHSKYSFSRIPTDGFTQGVEEHIRCARLVKQGKTIADEYPELKMTAIQQNDPPRINFSGPLVMKNTDSLSSTQERRAKQNVAMQAIIKHGPGGQIESPEQVTQRAQTSAAPPQHPGVSAFQPAHPSPSTSSTAHEGISAGFPPIPISASSSTAHQGPVGYQPPTQPPSSPPPSRRQQHHQLPQHPYLSSLPFQGPGPTPPLSPTGQGQEHIRPRSDQGHLPGQAHVNLGFEPGMPTGLPGWMEKGSGMSSKPGSQYPPYSVPYPGDRFHGGNRMSLTSAVPQADLPRMPPHYPSSGQSSIAVEPSLSLVGGSGSDPRLATSASGHPLNQEMLSALRLASQISHPQSSAMAAQQGDQQQQQQQQPPPRPKEQPLHHPSQYPLFRPHMQRPPISAHVPAPGSGGHAPPPSLGGPFSMPHPFIPGMSALQTGDLSLHFSRPTRMQSSGISAQGHEVGMTEGMAPRLPAPPIPMPGQRSNTAFLSSAAGTHMMAAGLFSKEGGGGGQGERASGHGVSFQALSPLTIQPPKSSPPDTRISSSFQGHAEGTPKPDKQNLMAPEKREAEPVMHRMVMPVGQPMGEYSLFASSSPWSMPLHSSMDSKSMASSPLSSHDSSMRNSPVFGFDLPGSYDMGVRHKVIQGEAWLGHGQGQDEFKGRGHMTHPGSMPSMWSDGVTMTPLERLLEQQRMQRQTDPH